MAEAKDAQSTQHRARYFALSTELFCEATLTGDFVDLNPSWASVFGHSYETLLGMRFPELVHPDDLEFTASMMTKMVEEDGGVCNFVNRMNAKDGLIITVSWTAVFDAASMTFMASGRNITEERVLQQRFDSFFTVSLEMLCVATTDGFFQELNPHWETVLGWTPAELKARPFVDFVHPDDRDSTLLEAQKLGDGVHTTVNFENRYRHKDGGWRWLRWSAALDPHRPLIIAAARDVTDIHERQRQLSLAVTEVRRANQAKSQFLANMSHELRTPLNSIIGFSKILMRDRFGTLDEKGKQYLGRVHDNGRHLLELINDVLDISKVESGHLELHAEPTRVDELLSEVRALQESVALEKQIDLLTELPVQIDEIHVDRLRLRQVVINLVANAIKFTPQGSVTIRAELWPGTSTLRAIRVIDTGIGIPADKFQTVFEPFAQADGSTARRFGGTGLGLSISRSLSEHMGLQLTLESTEGEGTTFSLVFPAQHRPRHIGSGASGTSGHDGGLAIDEAGRRVLVIDDDPDTRDLLGALLGEMNCRVAFAKDGSEAIAVGRRWRPELITLDLMMPRATGWDFLRVQQQDDLLRNVPVAVISAIAQEHRRSLGHLFEVVSKPIGRTDLEKILKRLPHQPCRALVLEDDEDARDAICEMLQARGLETCTAGNGAEGIARAESFAPDLFVVDLAMPVMDGQAFLHAIRSNPIFANTPAIIVTGAVLLEHERKALESQSDAVLTKGENLRDELRAALSHVRTAPPPSSEEPS